MVAYEDDFFIDIVDSYRLNAEKMTQMVFTSLASYEKNFSNIKFPLNRKEVKKNKYSREYTGTRKINRLNAPQQKNKSIQQNASLATTTNIRIGKSVIGDLDVVLLGPGQGTGLPKTDETLSFAKKIGYGEKDIHRYDESQLSIPTSSRQNLQYLFPMGSFLHGDYFFPFFNLLRVVYSTDELGYDPAKTKNFSDKRATVFQVMPVGVSSRGFTDVLKNYFLDNTSLSFGYRFRNDRLALKQEPEIIQLSGFTPSGKRFGQYTSINNCVSPESGYDLYQLVGVLHLNPKASKNNEALSFLNHNAQQLINYVSEGDIRD